MPPISPYYQQCCVQSCSDWWHAQLRRARPVHVGQPQPLTPRLCVTAHTPAHIGPLERPQPDLMNSFKRQSHASPPHWTRLRPRSPALPYALRLVGAAPPGVVSQRLHVQPHAMGKAICNKWHVVLRLYGTFWLHTAPTPFCCCRPTAGLAPANCRPPGRQAQAVAATTRPRPPALQQLLLLLSTAPSVPGETAVYRSRAAAAPLGPVTPPTAAPVPLHAPSDRLLLWSMLTADCAALKAGD